ncbi:hypothetical protein [Oceanobacillus profundus]|uniref:hypothetical protein n=1 Tax=Oceanobacillus profundus TaxID=372463 RepID=UPI0036270D45
MYIEYTDASIQGRKSYLAFFVVFENGDKIKRRIVVDELNNNRAEACAFRELVSFLDFYNFTNGAILYDSEYVKKRLKKSKTIRRNLDNLQIHTQIIPRKYNKAHKICYKARFLKSRVISKISRNDNQKLNGCPDYYLQFSAFEEYKQLFESNITFHKALQKINGRIWSEGNLEMVGENFKIYAIDDTWVKVHNNTIVKIGKEKLINNKILRCENHEAINQ